jgi:hypothetical protein
MQLQLERSRFMVTIDGEQKITSGLPAPQLAPGKVMLGMVNDYRAHGTIAEGQVAFADLDVRPMTGPRRS